MVQPNVNEPIRTETIERLKVQVFKDRRNMGRAAAADAAQRIAELQREQDEVRIVFAAAPSQNEFLEALAASSEIDWNRVAAFHMDEYIGLPDDAPQKFGRFLSERLFELVSPRYVHLMESGGALAPEALCERYAELLHEKEIDIVCLGIGENGHVAFNDPPVADFNDPMTVKIVELDQACRQQQVNDGCFAAIDAVPTHAMTLTIPALMSARHLYCIVPGPAKKAAVTAALQGPVTTQCPASILRMHHDCTLYLDQDSAP
jgi:glucosamine-6-phosphate deaminase